MKRHAPRQAAAPMLLATLFLVLLPAACGPPPGFTPAPVTLGTEPVTVHLTRPLAAASAVELCLEFDLPGDSRYADLVSAALVTADGRRTRLVVQGIDRKGERLVALSGAPEPAPGPDSGAGAPATIVGVELSATREIRLRGLRLR